MGLLSMTSEELRYKMKHLGVLCPNRSVCNDEQLYDLYSKLRDLIEDTEYNIDIVDLYTMLHNAMEDYINYDDEKLNTELLFGGLSVADRVTSINNKIDSILYN